MRMWEIRENSGHYDRDMQEGRYGKEERGYRMGMRKKTVEEAYECGYEEGFDEGYETAKKEMEEKDYRKRR